MNFIQEILLIFLIVMVIVDADKYFTLKKKPESERDPKEFKKIRRDFIWHLAIGIAWLIEKIVEF